MIEGRFGRSSPLNNIEVSAPKDIKLWQSINCSFVAGGSTTEISLADAIPATGGTVSSNCH